MTERRKGPLAGRSSWLVALVVASISRGAFAQSPPAEAPASAPPAPPPPGDAAPGPTPSGPVPPPNHEVVIEGDRADALKRASGSGTAINAKAIRDAQPVNAGELLRRVPGLSVHEEDPTGLRLNLGVRGLSPTRSRLVLVEEDGVPVVVSPYGEPELYYTTAVERMQSMDVVKGSDVLMYGPQTVGAVIQIHTWDPTEKPSWIASTTLGTSRFGEALGRYAATVNDVGYVVQVFHKGGSGVRDMPFQATDAIAKVRFSTGHGGEATVKIGFHDDDAKTTYTGLTDALYREDPRRPTIAPDDDFAVRRVEASLSHEQRIGESFVLKSSLYGYQMDLGLRLQDFDRARLPQIDYVRVADPTGLFFRNTTSIRDRTYDVAGATVVGQGEFKTGIARHTLTLGVRGVLDDARRKLLQGSFPAAESGALLTDDASHILGAAAWAADRISFKDFVLVTPAFRFEHSASNRATYRVADNTMAPHDVDLDTTTSSTGLMPGIGVIVGVPELNVFSSAYLGYSAPRISQAITPGGQDANLHAEHSRNYELGIKGRIGGWIRWEANGFWIDFDNQLVSNNPLSGSDSEFIDGGPTRHIGAEASVTARIGKVLHAPLDLDVAASYTGVRSRFGGGTFDGKTVPYSPANVAAVTVDAGHQASGISGEVAFSYTGSQYTDEDNTVAPGPTGLDGRIDPYTTLDFSCRYRNPVSGVGVSATLKNALNNVYVSDRLPNGIFTSGFREFFMSFFWSSPD